MTAARRAPGVLDVLVAAGCWVVLVAVLLTAPLLQDAEPGSVVAAAAFTTVWWWCLTTITVQAAVLVWARARPRTAPVTVVALSLPLALLGSADLFSLTSGAVLAAVFLAVTVRPLRALAPTLAVTALLVVVGVGLNGVASASSTAGPALTAGLLQAVGAVGLPLLLGAAVTGRRDARAAHRSEARATAGEQEALVRAAVADERTAMARELHDIAAHHLSGIALMAAAVDRQIDVDPERAKRSVREVRAQSTAVLDDLRRLVGLLRTDTEAERGVHSLAGVAELVDRRRAAGVPVELRTLGTDGVQLGDRVGPVAQLALYRIAQESLANAATHAPGSAAVVEIDDREPTTLTLTITNGPGGVVAGTRPGFGLVGMRERADLLGAVLAYGPTAEGGWQVRVTMPRDGVGTVRATPAAPSGTIA